MDEKNFQLFETTLATESAKAVTEVGKNVAEDLVRPTSKSIGANLGLLVDGVMGWLGIWGQKQKIKQQVNLDDFKNKIASNIDSIPNENLKEPTMYVVGPAIEASKYYFEEHHYKEMFAKLIAASCDDRYSDKISPYFVEAIKQLSPKDASILSTFKSDTEQSIVNYRYKLKNNGGEIDCFTYVYYFSSKHQTPNNNSSSLVNLERLGLLSINFERHFLDESLYSMFANDPTYLVLKEETSKQSKINPNYPYDDLIINKGIVKLTPLGVDFINLCL